MRELLELIGAGAVSKVARAFNVTAWAVCQWRDKQVPADRVLPLCELVGYQVRPHALRPDLYPNETDGLPL